MKHRYSDALSVFGEGRYQHGESASGLTHAYGLDYAPTDTWTFGLNFETGELTQEIDNSRLDRTAVAATAGYHSDDVKYGVALEYRNDESNTDDRISWLMRNNFGYQVDQDWRAQGRLDFAFSDSDQGNGNNFNSDFVEAIAGFGYRPVSNDRFNALFKYTYLMDLAPFDQFTASGAQGQNQQRRHVFSLDAIYDLSERWTIGGKYAYRRDGGLRNLQPAAERYQ
jgi:lipopolysaccharide assembly outer membrane protein LptD (OstA)